MRPERTTEHDIVQDAIDRAADADDMNRVLHIAHELARQHNRQGLVATINALRLEEIYLTDDSSGGVA